jgi:hypothetical protein
LETSPPSVNRLSKICGILNVSQLDRHPNPLSGLALIYLSTIIKRFEIATEKKNSPYLQLLFGPELWEELEIYGINSRKHLKKGGSRA